MWGSAGEMLERLAAGEGCAATGPGLMAAEPIAHAEIAVVLSAFHMHHLHCQVCTKAPTWSAFGSCPCNEPRYSISATLRELLALLGMLRVFTSSRTP